MKKLGLLFLLCALPIVASASSLNGQSGTLNYLFPDMNTIFESHSFTAPATVITLTYGPDLPNVISGNSIDITFGNTGYTFTPAPFNGEQFIFPGFTFTNVTMSTNLTGTTFSWDAHDIWVNWEGLTPNADSFVDFTINGNGGSVPEPASLLLLGSGLVGLGGLARKRLSK